MTQLPRFEVQTSGSKAPTGVDTALYFATPDGKAPSAHAERLARLKKQGVLGGKPGATTFLRMGGKAGEAENLCFVALGANGELTEEQARQAGGLAWARLNAEKCRKVAIQVDSLGEGLSKKSISPLKAATAFAEGLALSAYSFAGYRTGTKSEPFSLERLSFVCADKTLARGLDDGIKRALAAAQAVNIARDWSNEPSNIGTPEYYTAQIRALARKHGLKIKILTEQQAAREKMGLFLGVSRGSDRDGRVIVVEYNPKGTSRPKGGAKTVALVGKGITFDSGGISIKPALRMEEMKHDMTGAATVIGAVILASAWKVPNHVVGVVGFCENMPGGDAIQPGNVLKARNGKTVEIINTDAEGRLILGDLLDLAQDYKPDAIVDVATLTGAVSIALGKLACGILGNDDGLIEAVRRSGEAHGERIWQLPLFDDYFDDMKSDVADMKNSVNDGNGGTIRGAIFLKQFVKKGQKWAHLDIAATAWGLTHIPYFPKKGASGAYVRTLAQFAQEY